MEVVLVVTFFFIASSLPFTHGDLFLPHTCAQCAVQPPYPDPLSNYPGPRLSPAAKELLRDVAVATTVFTESDTNSPRPHALAILREVNQFSSIVGRLRVFVFHSNMGSLRHLNQTFPHFSHMHSPVPKGTNPFLFAFSYRPTFKQLAESPNAPSAYVFIEEDIKLTVDALASWANDQVHLEPLGYFRSFFRVIYHPSDGCLTIGDTSNQKRLLDDEVVTLSVNSTDLIFPAVHRHFLARDQPYCAMFAASHKQLSLYVQTPSWTRISFGGLGIRETASSGVQMAYPREKVVVPLQYRFRADDPPFASARPSMFAAVYHLSRLPEGLRQENRQDDFHGRDTICVDKYLVVSKR